LRPDLSGSGNQRLQNVSEDDLWGVHERRFNIIIKRISPNLQGF